MKKGLMEEAVKMVNWIWLLESGLAVLLALLVVLVMVPNGLREGVVQMGEFAGEVFLPWYALLSLVVLAAAVRRGKMVL